MTGQVFDMLLLLAALAVTVRSGMVVYQCVRQVRQRLHVQPVNADQANDPFSSSLTRILELNGDPEIRQIQRRLYRWIATGMLSIIVLSYVVVMFFPSLP